MKKTKDKIAIVASSLGGGGASRFVGQLSMILHNLGYEIHIVIVNDLVHFPYEGELCNLEKLSMNSNFISKKIKKGILLNRYLNKNKIDIIIDNRSRNVLLREIITKWIYGKRRIFYVVHSYNLHNYFPESVFFAKKIYQTAEKLICVSKAIETKIKQVYNLENTRTIYNPIDAIKIDKNENINTPEKFILFFGRFEEKVKNFTLMLNAFVHSKLSSKGFELLIMGEGKDVDFIENKIADLNLQHHVKIIPFQVNPFEYVKKAKFTLLTSYYEGFPLSIIESLVLGTPVVAVNCASGPAEIITNEYNGLLVENHNIDVLAAALDRFVDDVKLYDICKNNAIKSIEHLSTNSIAAQWEQLLSKK